MNHIVEIVNLKKVLKEHENHIVEATKDIVEYVKSITWNSMVNLEISELTEIVALIRPIYDLSDEKKNIELLIEEKRANLYPELKVAKYFPILRTIPDFSEKQISEIDAGLSKFKVGQIINSLYGMINVTWHEWDLLVKFLMNTKIVEEYTTLECPLCSNNFTMYTKEEELEDYCTGGFIYCGYCDAELDVEEIKKNHSEKKYKLLVGRSTEYLTLK